MTSYRAPMVRKSGNRLITTSLAVSHHFGKKHQHILESIKKLDCSHHFRESNFRPSSYTTSQNKRLPMYEITRDGFMFLCMGFTGKSAAQWKERYISAFNQLAESSEKQTINIQTLQAELLKQSPLWQDIITFKGMGLNHVQIAKLTERNPATVRRHVRKLEVLGLLTPPKNLPKMQQLALNLPHIDEVCHG